MSDYGECVLQEEEEEESAPSASDAPSLQLVIAKVTGAPLFPPCQYGKIYWWWWWSWWWWSSSSSWCPVTAGHAHSQLCFIRQRLQCSKVDLKAHGVRLIVPLSLPLNLPARQLGSTSPEVVVVNQPLQLSSSFSFSSSSAVLLVVLFSVLLSPKG